MKFLAQLHGTQTHGIAGR